METLILPNNNLYRNGQVILFDDGDAMLTREPIVWEPSTDDEYYKVLQKDRIDVIAWKHYGPYVEDASKFWWVIADANTIINPLDLSEWVGKMLLIPNILNVLLKLE